MTGRCGADEGRVYHTACNHRRSLDEKTLAGRTTAAHLLLLLILCGVLFLLGAWSLPLADPEEARCALIVRQMARSGHWIVPYFDGHVYYDKPAPFFWLAAAGWKLTGSAELSGRLVSAVAGLLGVLASYALTRRLFGSLAGLLAGVILATSGEFLFLARWYRMDMPFVAAMWAALWWFWRCQSGPEGTDNKGVRRRKWLGFYAFCAIATLFKGPAGLVLPVMVVATYLLLSERPRLSQKLVHKTGAGEGLQGRPWRAPSADSANGGSARCAIRRQRPSIGLTSRHGGCGVRRALPSALRALRFFPTLPCKAAGPSGRSRCRRDSG